VPDLVPRDDVTAWTLLGTEPRGVKAKDWLRDEETGDRWLFKPRGEHSDGSVQVGDWVEWVSAELGSALGIQTAEIRLGLRDGVPGCLSRHVTPSEAWDMQSGQLWLHDHRGVAYSSSASSRSHRNSGASPGHSIANVRTSLEGLVAPPGYDPALTAWDIFVAHLLLDALTSNRDRHEQNWSVMRPLRGEIALAPTYDLENGLGFQLLDAKRKAYLDDPPALEQFAERGTATRFEGVLLSRRSALVRRAGRRCGQDRSRDTGSPHGRSVRGCG
jgi:hypothetical protein